jgi:hypothetical protein
VTAWRLAPPAAAVCALGLAVVSGGAAGAAAKPPGMAPKGERSDAKVERTDRSGRRACRRAVRRRSARRCAVLRRPAARTSLVERLVAGRSVEAAPPAPGGGAPPTPGSGSGGGPDSAPPLARFVSVAAREWSLTLSRPVVGAGTVTVELRNLGEDPHNLIVSPDDGIKAPLASWPELDPEATLRQALALATGEYRLWCSLEGHEALGMSVRLRVE